MFSACFRNYYFLFQAKIWNYRQCNFHTHISINTLFSFSLYWYMYCMYRQIWSIYMYTYIHFVYAHIHMIVIILCVCIDLGVCVYVCAWTYISPFIELMLLPGRMPTKVIVFLLPVTVYLIVSHLSNRIFQRTYLFHCFMISNF